MAGAVTWRRRLREDLPIFALFAAITMFCAFLAFYSGSTFTLATLLANLHLYPQAIAFALAIDIVCVLAASRPASPTRFLLDRYNNPAMRDWVAKRLPSLAVLCLFLPLFAILKPMVSVLNPFDWDAAFIAWDRALFGTDPWRLLQPVLGYPLVTSAFSFIYHGWFLLVLPFPLFMLFSRRADAIRRRYLFSYLATWTIMGFVLATALSSMGPCFLEPLAGNAHFAEQMAYLYQADESYPVLVLDVQEALLEPYLTLGPGYGPGITAMPSMHVALAFLSYLAVRHVSRRAGQLFLAFCMLIFVGSVHLAYHYAVDGIVSIVVTAAIWWATKHLFAWWDRQHLREGDASPKPAMA